MLKNRKREKEARIHREGPQPPKVCRGLEEHVDRRGDKTDWQNGSREKPITHLSLQMILYFRTSGDGELAVPQ